MFCLFVGCHEYGQFIYNTTTVPNTIPGESPIVKKTSLCTQDAVELIIGGIKAKKGEFPHMALIGFGEGNPEGSESKHEYLITKSHFLFQFSRLQLRWIFDFRTVDSLGRFEGNIYKKKEQK